MKPGATLFAVNSSGQVFALRSDKSQKWTPLPFLGINFKRLTATQNALWALGGDHQIYVCVFGVEIPIRVKEETYENQRWTPVNGFSNTLLPTDRPNFSTVDGLHERQKDNIKLPTMAWQWESPWYVDTRLNTEKLEKDGWSYAVDFPAEYSASKKFTSCVRRRKWIRYRKYIAIDTWSAVPGVGEDSVPLQKSQLFQNRSQAVSEQEPFLDLAVGGNEIPGGDPDEALVWAVSVLGKVYVRQRVTTQCPEGMGWLHIPTPDKSEVSQISVGPTGLVWAVTWHGKALVRLGVTRIDPCGTSWSVLDPPGPSAPLNMVAVGNHAVWAISRDRRVWFRNGIHGGGSGDSEALARGVKWVGMVGEMSMISIGPMDQVVAIQEDSKHDRSIVVRTGISASDLSGKTWKVVSAAICLDFQGQENLRPNLAAIPMANEEVENKPEKEEQKNPSNITEGSSNFNFRKTATKIGDETAKQMATSITYGAMRATVGRIPVAGPILSTVTANMVRDELSKVKLINDTSDGTPEVLDLCQLLMKPNALWMKNGTFFDHNQLCDTKILIFYFSAHWCPPCRQFTPILAEKFENHQNQSCSTKSCVVFVSRDRNEQEQMDYMKESHGDWPSVPCQSNLQTKLTTAFQVEGIPMVVVVKVSDGKIITKGGKEKIEEHGSSAFAQWEWDHADEDEAQTAPALQSGSNTDENSKTVQESMYKSALDHIPPGVETDTNSDKADSLASDNAMFDREDFYGDGDEGTGSSSGPQWTWLTNGSCKLDPSHLPAAWFVENMSSQSSLSNEAWRMNILENLKSNNAKVEAFKDYETAIERVSWVRKGSARALFASGGKWENCSIELEQTGTQAGGEIEFGTLSIFGTKDKNKEHLSLSEITCVCRIAGEKTLAIHTPARSFLLMPLILKFNGDLDMEEWQSEITAGMNSVMKTQSRPNTGSLISVTNKGEVCVFDSTAMEKSGLDALEKRTQDDGVFTQSINVSGRPLPIVHSLENGFGVESSLFIQVKMMQSEDSVRFALNLHAGRVVPEADIAFHFNPRLDQNKVVMNDRKDGNWGTEVMQPLILMQEDSAVKVFNPGLTAQILIESEAAHLKISVNGTQFAKFKHRMRPEEITHLRLYGDIEPQKLEYRSKSIIIPPKEMYWRILGGGHMLQVEACTVNHQQIMWGLGYDWRVWIYTGGWGGAHFKDVDSSKGDLLESVEDSRYYYIYENQRWNPLTGFTSHGLPTDRYSWSDKTGKTALNKETIKLPSVHWSWTCEWLIDFSTPGGVDHDGWQYATDFPASYHGKKRFTDYVRRRRWTRKCRHATTGPWHPLGATRLVNVSMKPSSTQDLVYVWAVTAKGEALFRTGVSSKCPEGLDWTHVSSDVAFQSITISGKGTDVSPFKVWAVAKDGSAAFLRHGITNVAPTGQLWLQVHLPMGNSPFKSVTGGDSAFWALDVTGKLWYRQEVTPVFPEGTSWTSVPGVPSTPNAFSGAGDIKAISASGEELWAILDNVSTSYLGSSPAANALVSAMGSSAYALGSVASAAINAAGYGHGGIVNGVIVRRSGITSSNPMGVGWEVVIGGGWKDLSIRGRLSKHFKLHF